VFGLRTSAFTLVRRAARRASGSSGHPRSVSCSIGGQRGQSSSDNAVSSTSSTVNMNRGAQALALTAYDEFDKRFPAPPAPEPVPSPRFDL